MGVRQAATTKIECGREGVGRDRSKEELDSEQMELIIYRKHRPNLE